MPGPPADPLEPAPELTAFLAYFNPFLIFSSCLFWTLMLMLYLASPPLPTPR